MLSYVTRRLLLILTLGLLLAAGYWLYQQWPQLTYQLIRWQMQFHRKLGSLLRASASLEPSVIASLIATSFAYGVFHAAGPGHGKLVVATYLATQPSRLKQAVRLSIGAAMLQGMVAILLIGVAGWLFDMTARQAQGVGVWLDRSSFLLVALMGLFLAQRAARQLWQLHQPRRPWSSIRPLYKANASEWNSMGRQGSVTALPANQCGCGHSHLPDAEELNQAESWRAHLGILLSMGLRPCSGALLILVLAKVMEHFWLGVAATLAMAAGTALTVSLLAILSQRARSLAWAWLRHPSRHGRTLQQLALATALVGGLLLILLGLSLMSAPTSLLLPR